MKTFFTCALELVCIFCAAQIPPGAIGEWPFDNNALDVSGNGNHGTPANTIPAHDRFNRPNMAYKFNGVSSKVVVPHNSSIDIANGTNFSFAYWQKSYSGNADAVIITKHQWGNWDGYNFIANNQQNPGYCQSQDHMYWYVAAGYQEDACSDTAVLADSTWHLIVGTFDATMPVRYLYIDGVLQADIGGSSGGTANTANLSFGFDDNTNAGFFHGVLDGARLYNRMLNQTEIDQLKNECVPSKPVSATASTAQVICRNTSTTLRATSSGTVKWYSSLSSTVAIGTGTAFTTPTLAVGVYTFYAAGSSTCTSSLRTAVTVTVSECTSFTELMRDHLDFSIFPNPAASVLTIRSNLAMAAAEVIILDQLGQEVYRGEFSHEQTVIDVSFAAGVYFVEVRQGGICLKSKKLVIQN